MNAILLNLAEDKNQLISVSDAFDMTWKVINVMEGWIISEQNKTEEGWKEILVLHFQKRDKSKR